MYESKKKDMTDNRIRRLIARVVLTLIACSGMVFASPDMTLAAAQTVTLKYGSQIWFGSDPLSGHTSLKWVTHIDGEAVDLDEVPGVSRSYAYCVQPTADPPPEGTYNVSIIDDDDTGKISKMRKLIYYLPGSYGYAKVTKSRWFSGYSTEDAYAIGHTALSWIYDNYKEDDTVWGGAPSAYRTKTKSIVSDLSNLPDPPDSFEVFWIKVSGKQDVFGAFYNTEYGKVKVKKSSELTAISNDNGCYSLAGAKFALYTDQACTDRAILKNGDAAVITTKADGSSDPVEIETGDYYIKETKAPPGYALNTSVTKITVSTDTTYTYSCKDVPITDLVNLMLTKNPVGYPHDHGEGDATLAGAVYEFKYYAGHYSTVAQAEGSGTNKATWYLMTDANGRISGQNPVTASGYTSSAFYRDKDNKICYPLGTYVIREVKAPEGYLVNNAKLINHITEDGTDNPHVTTYNESIKGDDTIIRGGVKLAKIDNDLDEAYAQGDATLQGAEFTIYNQSVNSVMVGGREIAKGDAALVITTNADGIASTGDHDLPYGSYLVKETKPSEGYLLNTEWSRAFTIREDGVIVDLTEDKVREAVIRGGVQIIKRDKELVKSELLGGAHLDEIEFTIKNVSGRDVVVRKDLNNKTDKVDWKKLESKSTMFEDGSIKRVPTGQDVGKIVTHWNEEKKAYTAETLADDLPYGTYTIRESKTNESYQRTDKTEHMFTIREDGVVIAYDDNHNEQALTFDNYVYRSDVQGTKIADSTSERFSYVPFKIISVTNGETHVVVTDANGFFSTKDRRAAGDLDEDEAADTARKQNPFDDLLEAKDIKTADLKARKNDILHGVWFGTGEFGSKADMDSRFGALPYDSYILEEMPCEHNEGYILQKFYFTVDQKSQNGFVDLETITDDVPEIGTTASVNGENRNVKPDKNITLVDKVSYIGLKKGETYTLKARLIDKSTGQVIKDAEGREITKEHEFKPWFSSGSVKVKFEFDGSLMYGRDTVVFEQLYGADGHLVAKHEEIEDEDQTVTWEKLQPSYEMYKIRTSKAPKKGDKYGFYALDTVEYEVHVQNTGNVTLTMDVTDEFTQNPEFFTLPRLRDVRFSAGGTWNNRADYVKEGNTADDNKNTASTEKDKNTTSSNGDNADNSGSNGTADNENIGDNASITIEPGEEAVVVFTAVVRDEAKEYLAADKKDSDSLDDHGKDTNKEYQKNKHDDHDGFWNKAYCRNVTYPNPKNPDEPGTMDDKDDVAQTPVQKPEIGTTLADEKGSKSVVKSEQTVLVDTIEYKGLDPDKWYVFKGVLIVKDTKEALTEKGKAVEVTSEPFRPKKSEGKTSVTFKVNTSGLVGKELVAFETAYRLNNYKEGADMSKITKTAVAEHKDMGDEGQTVKITEEPEKTSPPEKSAPPKTGDDRNLWIWLGIAAAAMTLLGGTVHFVRKK